LRIILRALSASVLALSTLLTVTSVGSGIASATTNLHVCSTCSYTTVQAAVEAASSGDTIDVAAGRYGGPITVDVNVNLIGDGSSVTTLRGGLPVIAIGAGVTVNIFGFTISDSGTNASPTETGGGLLNAGKVMLRHTVITGNFSYGGAGIYNDGGVVSLQDSTVSNNEALSGGGILNANGVVVLNNSAVTQNTTFGYGGGAGIDNDGLLFVDDTQISGNKGGNGGGIFNQGSGRIVHSTITQNGTCGHCNGGGINNSGTLSILNSSIDGNSSFTAGAAANDSGATMVLDDSKVDNNSAIETGGISNVGSLTLFNSRILDNTAGTGGGMDNLGKLTLQNSVVKGNTPNDCDGC
jgi:hypothetical protein